MFGLSMFARCKTVLLLSALAVSSAAAQTASGGATELPASARLSLPGEKHKWLEPLVGRWNVEMRVWPAPGAEPIVSRELSASRQWMLGGRYLREELSGRFAGNPSNRLAYLSFNNLDERFELATMDTFEPGQMWYVSRHAVTPDRIVLTGESTEAGMGPKPTGRKRELRLEFEIAADRNVQRIYVKYPGETEFLFVEQRFTRAK